MPSVSGVELKSGNAVSVSFTEEMSSGGTVTVENSDGVVVAEDVPVALNAERKGATLTAAQLGISQAGGSYNLTFEDAKDASVRENVIQDYTATIVAEDVVQPTGSIVGNAADNVTVYFDEQMDTTTLSNKDNYIVNGKYLSNISGAELTVAGDGQSVTIDLDGTTITEVTLLDLKDLSGNTVSNFNNKVTTFGAAPTLVTTGANAEATSKNTVQFTIPQNSDGEVVKFSAIDPSTFTLEDTSEPVAVATQADYSYNATNTTVTLTFNTDVTDMATTDGAVDLVVENDLTQDQYGNSVGDAFTSLSVDDSVKPSVTKSEAIDLGVKLTFSEDLADATLKADVVSDVILRDADGNRVSFSASDVTEVENGVVTITGIAAADDYTVQVVPSAIQDVNGNLVKPYTSDALDVAGALPSITSSSIADSDDNGYLDNVVLNFNEATNEPTASDALANITLTDADGSTNLLTGATATWTDADTLTITLADTSGTTGAPTLTYSADGTGDITDLVGNLMADVASYTVSDDADAVATVNGTATNGSNTFKTDFSEDAASVSITSQANITEAVSHNFDASVDATTATFTVANGGATDGESFTFTVTDDASNVTTYVATFDNSAGTWSIAAQ